MSIKVKVFATLNHGDGLPCYAKPGDSGMDIRANVPIKIEPKQTLLIPTGIYVGIPDGYEIQVRPRSGMSLKTKLRVANAPGTVDASYRGELCIIAENTHGSVEMNIGLGERIAQLVLQQVPMIEWFPVASIEELGSTERGHGGFGSTG